MRFQLIIVAFLEVMALVLAHLQGLLGVHTDEAKYLLNIPYPHPPLARSMLHAMEWLPFQESFWRVILATLLIQAVWLLWDACRDLHPAERFAVSATWVFSAALILQSGSVMMAPITAVQALIFVWAERRVHLLEQSRWMMVARWLPWTKHTVEERSALLAFLLGLLWIGSLFTAFHIVLFLPLVWVTFRQLKRPLNERILYIVGPLVVLFFYSIAHPLILASFSIHASKDASISLLTRVWDVAWLWILAGSLVGTLFGLTGIFWRGSWALRITTILVTTALLGANMQYYAILLLPLIIGGLIALFADGIRLDGFPYTPVLVASTAVLVALAAPWYAFSAARPVSRALHVQGSGTVLIVGSFGHEWQYENTGSVLRFNNLLLPKASAVVCLASCTNMVFPGFQKVEHLPKQFLGEAWVRKK